MGITATELSRKGDRVKVLFNAGINSTDKYVDAAEWDTDPQKAIAQFSDGLPKSETLAEVKTSNAAQITMTDKQIADKLAAIAAAKTK